jgi:integrase
MSVHKRKGKRGDTWFVRYREGGRQVERGGFPRKGDAEDWELRYTRQKLGLPVQELVSGMTLAQFIETAWQTHVVTLELSKGSREKYAWALEVHCKELLDRPLAALTVPALAAHQQIMLDRGASANTIREVFMYLGRVLQVAVMHGHLKNGNPARGVLKAKRHRRREKPALTPHELETLLLGVTGRSRAIVVLGGWLGLRPLEIVRARWDMLVDGELRIGSADTKTTAAWARVVKVDRLALAELRAWQLESGGRGRDPIVGDMTENALKLWGSKHLRPRVSEVTGGRIAKASTYTLRHTHASALHYAGFTVPEAARRLGHSNETHLIYYAHVLDMGGERYADLDALHVAALYSTTTQHQVRAGAH